MLEMAINNVEMGSELDRVHILTCCELHLEIVGLDREHFIYILEASELKIAKICWRRGS